MRIHPVPGTLLLAGFLALAVTHSAHAQAESSEIIRSFTATDIRRADFVTARAIVEFEGWVYSSQLNVVEEAVEAIDVRLKVGYFFCFGFSKYQCLKSTELSHTLLLELNKLIYSSCI